VKILSLLRFLGEWKGAICSRALRHLLVVQAVSFGQITTRCSRPRGLGDLLSMELDWESLKVSRGTSGAAELKAVSQPEALALDE